jgi:hypothetical protein
MKAIIFLISLSAYVNFCQGQENNIRQSGSIKLAVNDSLIYEINIKAEPIIIGDSLIKVYSGDKLYVEATNNYGILKNYKVVKEIINKEKTLIIEFKQIAKKNVFVPPTTSCNS